VSLTTARTAQDAQLTLWPGSAAQETMTSSSNTFSDLVTGLDVTVTEQTTSPVVLDVAPDTEAISKLGSDLVSQLNLVLQEVSSRTASTTSTDSSGRTVVSGGVLSGNSTVRMLSENLLQAGSYDVDGESPSTIGITVASDGTLSFDEETFNAAYAQDPSKVQSILTSIAGRVEDVGSLASDKYTGTLTSQITEDNQQIRELTDRIASWESVLADRQTALEAQWANLETALQKMNSQSSWLTSIVSSLSTSSSSSSSSSS
jgi:flagellar hook-associated protein 2